MRFPGFIGPAYKLSSLKAECQDSINLFLEIDEAKTARGGEVGRLVATPGLSSKATLSAYPVRGCYVASNGTLYVISGDKLYVVSSSYVATAIGTLLSNTGPVDMVDNGVQVFIVDGSTAYIVTMATNAFAINADPDLIAGNRCGFIDGYFITNNPGTGQCQISSLYDGTAWDGLDFFTAEANPDPVLGMVVVNRQIWVFGKKTVEVYWNSGAADFPFSRVDGATIEYGCAGSFACAKYAGTVAWVTDQGVVMMANGYSAQRVSNHSIELELRKCTDLSSIYLWSYQQDGHYFLCINMDADQKTLVYDVATQSWHERSRLYSGQDLRHRASCYAFAFGKHFVGDFENGNLYEMSFDYKTDNGQLIARQRTSPHAIGNLKRVFVNLFQLDCQVGVGLSGTQQGTDPQIMMQVSRDGGYTWSSEKWRSIGKIGQTFARVIWRRLGQGRDWVVRVRYTEPTEFTILGAEAEIEQGDS